MQDDDEINLTDDNNADYTYNYEANLMRRLAGLLYIDNKTMGDIKLRVKQTH